MDPRQQDIEVHAVPVICAVITPEDPSVIFIPRIIAIDFGRDLLIHKGGAI